jgi:Plant transposon protein
MDSLLLTLAEHDEQDFAVALWHQMMGLAALSICEDSHAGGSIPGKAANKTRDFVAGHRRLMLDYFWPFDAERDDHSGRFGPVYDERDFERRFRMPRSVFHTIFAAVVEDNEYLRLGLKRDATGILGATPLQKVVAAIRQLSLGIGADAIDEYCRVSETVALKSMKQFVTSVTRIFGATYLREPTGDDLVRIERAFSEVGFPGCIGCLDCAGWAWKNCPRALQGIHVGKDGKPHLRLECVCDLDLYIWHLSFGYPGMLNDINILNISPLFSKILAGTFPPVKASYSIGGNLFDWVYFLADGIYPRWRIFVQTLSSPKGSSQSRFASRQEAVRKCVERVFGVLFARFHILCTPGRLWDSNEMGYIIMACSIIHNMIVSERKDSYSGDGAGGSRRISLASMDTFEATFTSALQPLTPAEQNDVWQHFARSTVLEEVKNRAHHDKLMAALIDQYSEGHCS